eukprot:g7692.t1
MADALFGAPVEENGGVVDERVEPRDVRAVLEDFYHCLKGEQWRNQKQWHTKYDIFTWEGLFWDHEVDPPQLLGLDLSNNNLEGRLPDSLGRVKSLRYLVLDRNAIQGGGDYTQTHAISPAIFRLPKLERLEMQHNELAGTLPPNMGDARMLTTLRLEHNYIEGPVPRGVGMMPRLRFFGASNNALSGELPEALAQCRSLEALWLDHNNLSGRLFERYKFLTHLSLLNVSHNKLDAEQLTAWIRYAREEMPQCRLYTEPQAKRNKRAKGEGRPKDVTKTYGALLSGKGVSRKG